jgi:hypothetical protein
VPRWEQRRAAMEGKAMVVTMSCEIAARLEESSNNLHLGVTICLP